MERLKGTVGPRHVFVGLPFLLPFIPETKVRKTLVDTESSRRLCPSLSYRYLPCPGSKRGCTTERQEVLITVSWLITAV